MVWGSMIAWYLFLAGASAGAFLTSAFVEAKYPDSVKMRVAGRIISPIFLGIGLLMLMLDAEAGLHNPLRFFYLIMNPGSVMTLGVYSSACSCRCSIPRALLEVLRRPDAEVAHLDRYRIRVLRGGLHRLSTGGRERLPAVEQRHFAGAVRGVGSVGGSGGYELGGPYHRS